MKTITLVVVSFILGAFVMFIVSNRFIKKLDNENALLKQKITGQQVVISEGQKAYIELKEESEADIAMLNGAIDSANTIIARREEELRSQDKRLVELREAQKVLTNKDDIIENLKEQVFLLDKKLVLTENIVREKDSIIFALTEKYEREHELRLTAEELMDKMARQISDQFTLIQNLEHELGVRKKKELLKQIASGGVAFLLGVVVGG